MKIPRLLACVALSATLSAPVVAQSATTGFHTVACIKVKPENAGEYRKWISEDVHKYAQSRVDAGAVSTWIVLRAVIPAGHPLSATISSSRCTPEFRPNRWDSKKWTPPSKRP
jgi:hypothetical protein